MHLPAISLNFQIAASHHHSGYLGFPFIPQYSRLHLQNLAACIKTGTPRQIIAQQLATTSTHNLDACKTRYCKKPYILNTGIKFDIH
jgi:hypothetical protein